MKPAVLATFALGMALASPAENKNDLDLAQFLAQKQAYCMNIGKVFNPGDYEKMFHNIDTNNDGVVTYAERQALGKMSMEQFLETKRKYCAEKGKPFDKAKYMRMFNTADTNKDGFVTQEEMEVVYAKNKKTKDQ